MYCMQCRSTVNEVKLPTSNNANAITKQLVFSAKIIRHRIIVIISSRWTFCSCHTHNTLYNKQTSQTAMHTAQRTKNTLFMKINHAYQTVITKSSCLGPNILLLSTKLPKSVLNTDVMQSIWITDFLNRYTTLFTKICK